MSWVNTNGQRQLERPIRVRLLDGFTRTNEEVTDDLLAELGWSWEVDEVVVVTINTSTEAGELL